MEKLSKEQFMAKFNRDRLEKIRKKKEPDLYIHNKCLRFKAAKAWRDNH